MGLVCAWTCLWMRMFAPDDEEPLDSFQVMSCIYSEFNAAASMNSGPFNACDVAFICATHRTDPRPIFYLDSNY